MDNHGTSLNYVGRGFTRLGCIWGYHVIICYNANHGVTISMCVSAFAVVVGDSSLAQSSLSAPSLRTFTGSSLGVASAAHLGMVAAIHGQDHGYLLRNHAPTFVCSRLGERFIQKATVFMQKKMRHLYTCDTCAYTYLISHIYIYTIHLNIYIYIFKCIVYIYIYEVKP